MFNFFEFPSDQIHTTSSRLLRLTESRVISRVDLNFELPIQTLDIEGAIMDVIRWQAIIKESN